MVKIVLILLLLSSCKTFDVFKSNTRGLKEKLDKKAAKEVDRVFKKLE